MTRIPQCDWRQLAVALTLIASWSPLLLGKLLPPPPPFIPNPGWVSGLSVSTHGKADNFDKTELDTHSKEPEVQWIPGHDMNCLYEGTYYVE